MLGAPEIVVQMAHGRILIEESFDDWVGMDVVDVVV